MPDSVINLLPEEIRRPKRTGPEEVIPVPAAALGVTIVPPPTSTNGKTLKGVTGDTGIPIDPANETSLTFTAGQNATLGITSIGAETITLFWK